MNSLQVKPRRGFSVIEVLIATFVLTFGILAVIGTFPSLLDMNQQSWVNIQAVAAAESKMGQIMQGLYGIPISTNCAGNTDHPFKALNTTVNRTYCGQAAPPDAGGTSQSNLQWVWVQVTWTEDGAARSVRVDNYLTY